MRAVGAVFAFIATEVLAHPGHGAPEGHFHAHAAEYLLGLMVVIVVALVLVARK
jgi:hypothetical protein